MIKKIVFASCLFSIVACEVEGVKKETTKADIPSIKKEIAAFNSDDLDVVSTEKYPNGMAISWMEKGKGESISKGDVVLIDYKVTLKNGTVVDGNHLLNKPNFPFMVGFEMQTKGWEFAVSKLKVGDFARVQIPGNLARGEKGIKGLIPPNAVNYLTIRILEKMKPTRTVDGIKVWLLEENKANKVTFDDKNIVTFHSMISSESHPMFFNSFRSNQPFMLKSTDKGVIKGLLKALKKSKKADRIYIYIPSSQAYGEQGLAEFVNPNESMFYNVLVMDVNKN